jgi:hypothetical protein
LGPLGTPVDHDVSPERPENAPNGDAFGHNRNRRLGHETLAFISILALLTITGAAFYRSAFDQAIVRPFSRGIERPFLKSLDPGDYSDAFR